MWSFLWTSDLFYHKVAIWKDDKLWEFKMEEKKKIARKDFYLAKAEKKNFLLLSSGQKVFCSEDFLIGQEKIVQVIQEERGEKLAEVSQKLELSGRFFVYFPLETRGSISKKIQEEKERERLRKIVAQIGCEGSFLIRTEAKGQTQELLEKELLSLVETWKEIQENAFQKRKKGKLYVNHRWIDEIIEKYAQEEWDFCYSEHFEEQEYFHKKISAYGKRMCEYYGETSLWETKQMDRILASLCQSQVDLGQGVSLYFERTKACITIDVNSAALKAKKANEMAAEEIPRQLRLRNWSGIVVIDFIDGRAEESSKLLSILQKGFQQEKSEIQWGGFQSFYLCIFTRQRKGQELETYFQKENEKYQIQLLENEITALIDCGEKNFSVEAKKKLWQEWKNYTQCGIKDSIRFSELKESGFYKIHLQK